MNLQKIYVFGKITLGVPNFIFVSCSESEDAIEKLKEPKWDVVKH